LSSDVSRKTENSDTQQTDSYYSSAYNKYMPQGAGQGGDYQQYMKGYSGNYSQYTQQHGGQSQGTDYQHYVDQYAGNYSKYMQQGASNGTELSENFKDKYGGKWAPSHANMTKEDAIHQYAGNYVPDVHNTSDSKAWAAAYQSKYAGAYEGYMKENEHPANPAPDQNAATATATATHAQTGSALAAQNTVMTASSKSTISGKHVDLATTPAAVAEGSIGAPAMLCMIFIGGAVGVFLATRKPQDQTPLEGYTSLLV